jgi:hypothetical protein
MTGRLTIDLLPVAILAAFVDQDGGGAWLRRRRQRVCQQRRERLELDVGRRRHLVVGTVECPGGKPRLGVDEIRDSGVDGLRGDDAPRGDRLFLTDAVDAVDTWTDNQPGDKRTAQRVLADVVGPSLRWATTRITKTTRTHTNDDAPDDVREQEA